MKFRACLMALLLMPALAMADNMTREQRIEAMRSLNWQLGPNSEAVAGKATLRTPNDQVAFLDESNSRRFLELTGNLPENGNYIILNKQDGWWADFSFNPIGYVKDDEKIDADALLKSIKENDGPANEQRKRLGLPPLHTEGWYIPPHYDPQTKRLEWGLKLRSDNETNLNYTIRLLGRTGVMNATLVSSPEKLDADVASFRKVLQGFEFNSGESYSEFKQGDRVAEYGLAALIAGGAAAVATKKGFWAAAAAFIASAWKIIVAAIVAALAGLKALFKRKEK
jgi:uncharacterized membrane-anchored protein